MNLSWGRQLLSRIGLTKRLIVRGVPNRFQPIGQDENGSTSYRISFGNVHIKQQNLGKSTLVRIPMKEFQALSQEIKREQRKINRRKKGK